MILVGNQRAGAKNLAQHLLKQENDHVTIHELRGFAARNLMGALNEAYAISKATLCKQFLYSLSMNPPAEADVGVETFEAAIERIEKRLGLSGQPRAVVFHEKGGRRHCHCVWSRINTETMTAINLPFTKNKLQVIARDLYLENGWKLPTGLRQAQSGDPRNFTHAQWQQAKRSGIDPKALKTVFQESWAVSDTQAGFAHALEEHGLILARGDRRGFVAVDYQGEVYVVAKWTGVKAKDVRTKLTHADSLPSVAEAQESMKADLARNLKKLADHQNTVFVARYCELSQKRKYLIEKHRLERQAIAEAQEKHQAAEQIERQARYQKGLRGLFDKLLGRSRRIKRENEVALEYSCKRDRRELDALIFSQLEAVRVLERRMQRLETLREIRLQTLDADMQNITLHREQDRLPQTHEASHKGRTGNAQIPEHSAPSR